MIDDNKLWLVYLVRNHKMTTKSIRLFKDYDKALKYCIRKNGLISDLSLEKWTIADNKVKIL